MDNKQFELKAHKSILSQYKSSAKRRGIDFELELKDISRLVIQPCAFCGMPPSNHKKVGSGYYPYSGIDRKDSKLGYTLENTITSCKACNSLKGKIKWDNWANWINSIVSYHGGVIPFPEIPHSHERKGFWKGF